MDMTPFLTNPTDRAYELLPDPFLFQLVRLSHSGPMPGKVSVRGECGFINLDHFPVTSVPFQFLLQGVPHICLFKYACVVLELDAELD